MRAAGWTDPGRVRAGNEDAVCVDPALGLCAVADGMGGHAAGQVASALAVEALREGVGRLAAGRAVASTAAEILAAAVRRAGRAVFEAAAGRPEWRGMGTTVAAVRWADGLLAVAHVGDSRVYLVRGGELRRLTEDHSLVAEQVRLGVLTAEEAGRSRHRNLLTRALGQGPDPEVDAEEHRLWPGDRVLLCTDGLTNLVPEAELLAVLGGTDEPARACRALVDAANREGGTDNISAVVVHFP